jgi:excinuclease ABC subunit C
LRNRITAIERISEKQKMVSGLGEDIDAIAYAQKDDEACVQIFMIRDGKLIEREHFFLADTGGWSSSEIIAAFLQQYYLDASFIPRNILIQSEVEMADIIEKWLESKKQSAVSLHVPQKGEKKALIDLVAKNAANTLEQKQFYTVYKQGDNPALIELGRLLNLPKQPNRIEAFDISNLGENLAVGSMVVFEGGEAAKSEYRRFRIKTVKGQNDFAMMQEVVSRRYKRVLDEGKILPDLILIDGGKGQLSSAYSALESLGLEETPIIGLAKQFEHIFVPQSSDPIILPKESLVLHLIQRLRDEAHRFANTYHRTLRDKTMKESILDEIPGIGQKRKFALLQKFGSLEALAAASIDELRAVEGMNQRVAERIKKWLRVES